MESVELVSMATFQSLNVTSSPYPPEMFSAAWNLLYALLPPYIFIVCLTGVLGNIFVLGVFLLQRGHWSVPEIYLGNLALADLLLLFFLPFWAMTIINKFEWSYGEFLCKTVNLSFTVNMYSSIYMMVMVNVDRYLALVQTMRARWLRRKRYAKVICFGLWLFGLVMGAPSAFYRTVQYHPNFQLNSCVLAYPDNSWRIAHDLQLNVVGFAIPLLVIVFCSCNIVRALHRRREKMCTDDGNDRKATVLVCAVTMLFLVCWGPFQIMTLLHTLCNYKVLDEEIWYHTLDIGDQISTYLAFLNSSLNPVLYVFIGFYFRRKLSEIWKRRKHSIGSVVITAQRSVISTYLQRTEKIQPVVL